MKVKLDKATLQQFFLDNGEKIILAAVALGAGDGLRGLDAEHLSQAAQPTYREQQ